MVPIGDKGYSVREVRIFTKPATFRIAILLSNVIVKLLKTKNQNFARLSFSVSLGREG